jgi:hypothetical protein
MNQNNKNIMIESKNIEEEVKEDGEAHDYIVIMINIVT